MYTKVKTTEEIESMRIAGKMLATVLQHIKNRTVQGMSTQDLADRAAAELKSLGGAPSFLGYQGFPDVLCVSVNDEVVHGIPSKLNIIENGDIVSIDFGVTYKGMVTDAAVTFAVGDVEPNIATGAADAQAACPRGGHPALGIYFEGGSGRRLCRLPGGDHPDFV